jgi:tryptophanyl-tRNA synthetase
MLFACPDTLQRSTNIQYLLFDIWIRLYIEVVDPKMVISDAQMNAVNDAIENLIKADTQVFEFEMSRVEAEGRYGNTMYDAEGLQDEKVETLSLVYIPNVIIHTSVVRHVPSLAILGNVNIKKGKWTKSKKLQEFIISVTPSGSSDQLPQTCPPPSTDEIEALKNLRIEVEVPVPASSASPDAVQVAVAGGDAPDATPAGGESKEMKVDPWSVTGDIDYDKLIRDWGCARIDDELIARMEKLTGKPAHPWLKRGHFFSHRDLNLILDAYEKGEKFFLYTGRGPSSDALHMGHLIPFKFTKWLQDTFKAPLVIQLTDDEKYLFRDESLGNLDYYHKLAYENAKDIIACGFDKDLTFIFSDLDYIHTMYPNILRIQKATTLNQAMGIFGFTQSDHIGKQAFPAVQVSPCFSSTFPVVLGSATNPKRKNMTCLVPCAIDQDPYFRLARAVADRVKPKEKKCALIHSKFVPSLQGADAKMSASDERGAIYVTDTPKMIASKINKYALSGGCETVEEHRLKGANLNVDVSYIYLTYFLEDEERLQQIAEDYRTGKLLTGEVKKILIDIMSEVVLNHQKVRAATTDDVVKSFMEVRELKF